MPKIFISYRRADSQFVADIIYDYMGRHFGQDNVFLDVGNIPFGVDFREYLRDQVQAFDVMLVLIGPDWGRIMRERADEPNDFVRIEIENALKFNKLIIPVRVMNAEIPDFKGLPTSIQDLQWRNAAVVRRQPDLANDCQRLADGIHTHFKSNPAPVTSPPKPTRSKVFDILPAPFDWCEIPRGKVTLEYGNFEDENEIYIYKADRKQTFDLPAYSIAKYPVTNTQFQVFVDASDGYSNPQWWDYSDAAKAFHQRHILEGTGFERNDDPRTNISWYDAVAFCRWLSAKSGEQISFPTEQQWQRSAQGNDNRRYPWGNTWDGSKCNNSVEPYDSRHTTSVIQYEHVNLSPFGVVDLSGNVSEWCLTEYNTEGNDVSLVLDDSVCTLRGGSWDYTASADFLSVGRHRSCPYKIDNDRGFRVALS